RPTPGRAPTRKRTRKTHTDQAACASRPSPQPRDCESLFSLTGRLQRVGRIAKRDRHADFLAAIKQSKPMFRLLRVWGRTCSFEEKSGAMQGQPAQRLWPLTTEPNWLQAAAILVEEFPSGHAQRQSLPPAAAASPWRRTPLLSHRRGKSWPVPG